MKVALAHDNIWQIGGAERVLLALRLIFPRAPVFTLGISSAARERLRDAEIRTSFIQRIRLPEDRLRQLVFLFPAAIRSFDVSDYDLVISSSWGFAKAVRVRRDACHVCYCHSPLNWAWDFWGYAAGERLPPGVRLLRRTVTAWFRRWDVLTAAGVTHYIANSRFTARRLREYYGKDSTVVEPPIDLDFWQPTRPKEDYGVVFSRLVPHKRIDIAVRAFGKIGKRLVVVGEGRDRRRVESMASANVRFVGWLSDRELRDVVSAARVTLIPGIEDFGLVVLESLACGTPVVVCAEGGASELIVNGRNGAVVESQDPEAFAEAASHMMASHLPVETLRRDVMPYALPLFLERIRNLVKDVLPSR